MAEHPDTALLAALSDRSERGTPRGAEAVVDAAWERHDTVSVTGAETHQRPPAVWVAAAAAVLLVVAAVAWLRPGPGPHKVDIGGTSSTTVPAGWQKIATLPAGERTPNSDARAVWTGTEVVLVGGLGRGTGIGTIQMAESPAVNLVTGAMRLLPEPPVPLNGKPNAVVWTGRDIVVVAPPPFTAAGDGFGPARTVAYDTETATWRTLDAVPPLFGLANVGTEVFGATASNLGVLHLDPDGWEDRPAAVPARGAMFSHLVGGDHTLFSIGDELAMHDPSGISAARTDFPPPPFRPQYAEWTGSRLLIYGATVPGAQRVAQFDILRATWTEGRPPPPGPVPIGQTMGWANGRFVIWYGQQWDPADMQRVVPPPTWDGLAYDPARDTWSAVPPLPGRPPTVLNGVGVGDRLIVWTASDRAAGPPTMTAYALAIP
jgi:hypothetical protein